MQTKSDAFIDEQLRGLLEPGEAPLYRAFVTRQPGLLWQLLSLGVFLFLMTKAYFVVLTDRRLILIRTPLGLFGPGHANQGVESIPRAQIAHVTTSGVLNNRSITFHLVEGPRSTLRISPWFKTVSGQRAFLEDMPEHLNTSSAV